MNFKRLKWLNGIQCVLVMGYVFFVCHLPLAKQLSYFKTGLVPEVEFCVSFDSGTNIRLVTWHSIRLFIISHVILQWKSSLVHLFQINTFLPIWLIRVQGKSTTAAVDIRADLYPKSKTIFFVPLQSEPVEHDVILPDQVVLIFSLYSVDPYWDVRLGKASSSTTTFWIY